MRPPMTIVGGAGPSETAAIVAAVTAVIDEEVRAARAAAASHAAPDEWVRSSRPDQVEPFEPNGWAPTAG